MRFLNHLDKSETCIAVDDKHLILGEYFRLLSPQLAPYLILTALLRQCRVLHKSIAVVEGVAVIPDELKLVVHDRNDRIFVAVALSFSSPCPIVNATDSDWVDWEEGLRDHGIEVIQLCPQLVYSPRDSAEYRA